MNELMAEINTDKKKKIEANKNVNLNIPQTNVQKNKKVEEEDDIAKMMAELGWFITIKKSSSKLFYCTPYHPLYCFVWGFLQEFFCLTELQCNVLSKNGFDFLFVTIHKIVEEMVHCRYQDRTRRYFSFMKN